MLSGICDNNNEKEDERGKGKFQCWYYVCLSVCPCLSSDMWRILLTKQWQLFCHCIYDTECNNTLQETTFLCYIGWLAECPQCYCGKFERWSHLLSIFIARKLSIDLIMYVSLNIIGKIIPKPNIFTGTRNQDGFWVCNLCSCNLAERNIFCLGAILTSCLVPSYGNRLHRDSNLGQFPGLWPLCL
jgi:hypothetical protein